MLVVSLFILINPNSLDILSRNHPKSAKIHQHAVKSYPKFMDFDTVANAKHPCFGCPESNKSSQWCLMDLVHMATCSIILAVLWSTDESIKIRQNQVVDFGGFGVVRDKRKQAYSYKPKCCTFPLTPSLRRPCIHAIFFSTATRIPFFESFSGSRVNTPLVDVTNVG